MSSNENKTETPQADATQQKESGPPQKNNGDEKEQNNRTTGAGVGENGCVTIPLLSQHPMETGQKIVGSVVSFHGLSYRIPISKPCACLKKKDAAADLPSEKVILDAVSGVFRPGLNAIMGPTGSGKTSLLDLLAARKADAQVCGKVLVNGLPRPHNFKCMTGYVIQDDTVMGMLTVRENIEFSAALRMPQETTNEKRKQRVDEVISDLGLEHCAGTRIGTELRRGISGGERKRTSIAMELLTSPEILFLDEPTTGLDACMAQNVIGALKRLAHQGKTIIFSVHQPRYSIYRMIDTLHLLLHGNTVYHGPAHQALPYFSSIGYECDMHNNPADFFLDVLGGYSETATETENKNKTGKSKSKEDITQVLIDVDSVGAEARKEKQNYLVSKYKTSECFENNKCDLVPFWEIFEQQNLSAVSSMSVSYPTNFFLQLNVVCKRTFLNMIRNPHTLLTQMVSSVILGILIGTIYFQLDDSYSSGIQNRVGAFFFIVMNHVFGNMAAVDMFIKDRALFIHENVSGFYRVSVYFTAKILCDVLPMRIIPIILFTLVSYWMIGFRAECSAFLFYGLTTILTSIAGTSVALTLSATAQTHTIGTILTALVWVIMMVFSGLLVNLKSIASWLQWIKYVSIFSYAMNAFTVNELKGSVMCDVPDPTSNTTHTLCVNADDYMTRQGIPHSTSWDLWANHVALVVIATFFLALTYIQLRRIKKYK